MTPLDETLRGLGADLASFHHFDADEPVLLPYATLLAARNAGDQDLRALHGVYEWQKSPLMFLVNADDVRGDSARLHRIRRLVAMRGDAPYLGVVAPGRLDVYSIALDGKPLAEARVDTGVPRGQEHVTFAQLANLRPGLPTTSRNWIAPVVLKLLGSAIDSLKSTGRVSDADAVSLVGRALFTRFLGDRDLLPQSPTDQDDGAARLFDSAEAASATSAWLDETFNGDFLPLSDGLFSKLPPAAFAVLGDVLRRAPGGQLALGWQERWDNLDFAHIPVGVLSQAYEHYLRRHARDRQRKEGGYYTPRPIADLMVRGALHALEQDRPPGSGPVRVLDPAAGAGVFLLTAFRQLVARRWRQDGARPNTRVLREILYSQLVGFDINEAALRFAALGLYLISIELDPHPEPVQKLRFANLRGRVLHKVGSEDGADARGLGSLGPDVGDEHAGQYDIVVGNPPWASATKLPCWRLVEEKVATIARDRLPSGSPPPPIPNEVLDLPFVWRAMEWCKPGGQIAFALHARVLFQQGDGMPDARRALFNALDVVGVVNGVELRQTKVWPEISAPFCLLYARNRVPGPGAGFRFVSPRLEASLNNSGQMRIDADNGVIVTTEQVSNQPEILKVLFRGGDADLILYERIRERGFPPLSAYWSTGSGTDQLGRCGNGYQRLRKSSRIAKNGDGLPGMPANFLKKLPDFDLNAVPGLLVDTGNLQKFRGDRVHFRRARDLYRAPLLIVHKSPPASRSRIRIVVAEEDVAFNQTYYGYSAARHADGRLIVRYFGLILSSKLALWLALITSGEFGFEREAIEKSTIDGIPVPDPERLSSVERRRIDALFDRVAEGGTQKAWEAVDSWAAEIYGLRDRDVQTISDTLKYNLPFAENRRRAQSSPSAAEIARFCDTLAEELAPWGARFGASIVAEPEVASVAAPWRGIRITRKANKIPEGQSVAGKGWFEVLRLADQLAATEVTFPGTDGDSLWLGRLDQARYWTETQARQVARRLVWHHIDFLSGRAS
ncbi:N-6 DNA methylase [Roseomonas mucosa]|uniref:HsdM family class I SAM-dependent methyltransferase n=1 Tax=Roseomonas mucosa TaxID=207340 RepID=UPI0028CD5FB9|nr:N-6 DNA methylase [Roseomonas mucosa]MDT8315440.1 N-6 DNA methylase [Roseomonas mucosa]MDT8361701.1 N-6 DNA methylase [Roseomonas mucosa]